MHAGTAEQRVFEKLVRSLPPREYCLHRRAGAGEVVVCHRRRGVLVLTIVPGVLAPDARTRHWRRLVPDGERAIRDPMRQAESAAWRLGDELRRDAASTAFVAHALVLPDSPVQPWPSGWIAELVIDDAGLERPRQAVDAALDATPNRGRVARALDEAQWRSVNAYLCPEAERALRLPAAVARVEPSWIELTDEQRRGLQMILALDRVAVEGTAGTGKTLIATAAARALARRGEKVLLLCYNRLLGELLAEALGETPGVTAGSFHQLCRSMLVEAGQEPPAPPCDQDRALFWREHLPRAAFDRAGSYAGSADTILVDEAHAFAPSWWQLLGELLRPGGRLVAFFDPNLDRSGCARAATADWAGVTLSVNRRSTAALNRAARAAGRTAFPAEDGGSGGESPEVRGFSGCGSLVRDLANELVRVTRHEAVPEDQVVILSPVPMGRSCLAEAHTLGDFDVVEHRPSRPDQVRFVTLRALAGLEAEVVLLVDVDPGYRAAGPEELYLAFTRARRRVVVWVRDDEVEKMRGLVSGYSPPSA